MARTSFLEGVYARAAEQAEQGPVGRWLDGAAAPRAEARSPGDGAPGARAAETAREVIEGYEDAGFARVLARKPTLPDVMVWADVRDHVLAAVAADPADAGRATPRRKLASRAGLAASAAAAAVLGAISLSDGTPKEPRIVFAELGKVPDVPFAIVRYGVEDSFR